MMSISNGSEREIRIDDKKLKDIQEDIEEQNQAEETGVDYEISEGNQEVGAAAQE